MNQRRQPFIDKDFWENQRVFLTGHTGFKGSWLTTWLTSMKAKVKGYSLDPPSEPSMFRSLELDQDIEDIRGDIRDRYNLKKELLEFNPTIIFHLAAQPIVLDSYKAPVETYETNVMGTVHLLDAVRACTSAKAVIVVTTDKCYENREWSWGYRESDALGGYDPYSSSKAASEIAVASLRSSFFSPSSYSEHGVSIATARAGNVLGGGDWSSDRLIPDAVRSFIAGNSVEIRNPRSLRPWQHVLEALSGYLILAQRMCVDSEASQAWNFGPGPEDIVEVSEIMNKFVEYWGDSAEWHHSGNQWSRHEASLLSLDCSKARRNLGWVPRINLDECLKITVDWYKEYIHQPSGSKMKELTKRQIDWYLSL